MRKLIFLAMVVFNLLFIWLIAHCVIGFHRNLAPRSPEMLKYQAISKEPKMMETRIRNLENWSHLIHYRVLPTLAGGFAFLSVILVWAAFAPAEKAKVNDSPKFKAI